MSDTTYDVFQHYGTDAQRLAFTPAPASGIQPIYIWYATDTGLTWLYDSSWHSISGPSGSLPSTVQGDMLYASAANTIAALAKDTNATRYLSNTGATNNPAWAQVNLANGVTGDLPFANLTQGSALSVLGVTGNATADNASIAAGTDHQVLRRSGTAVAFGAVNLAQSAAVTGVLPVANGGSGTASGLTIIKTTTNLNNTDIKALPTTPITLISAPAAGSWHKFLGGYLSLDASAGAYTNINATYAACFIYWLGTTSQWAAAGPVDDTTYTLTRLTTSFGAASDTIINLVPYLDTPSDGLSGTYWTLPNNLDPSIVNGVALAIAIDNNGSGNLTNGNAANTLKVVTYTVTETI